MLSPSHGTSIGSPNTTVCCSAFGIKNGIPNLGGEKDEYFGQKHRPQGWYDNLLSVESCDCSFFTYLPVNTTGRNPMVLASFTIKFPRGIKYEYDLSRPKAKTGTIGTPFSNANLMKPFLLRRYKISSFFFFGSIIVTSCTPPLLFK